MRRLARAAALALVMLSAGARAAEPAGAAADLMPLPVRVTAGEGALAIDGRFGVEASACPDDRVASAARRLSARVLFEAGLPREPGPARPVLSVACGNSRAASRVQRVVEDESYSLAVTPGGARLAAPSPYGALRGMETFAWLVEPGAAGEAGEAGFVVRSVAIQDAPRFPWRGLLLDSCRHFLPVPAIERTLDGMAAVKLNVLHWHLTEDQGFRIESRRFPRLHRMGSDGFFYTRGEIRRVVAYARDRGIRVVPELDVPGHATSWLVGHPELASGKGPYAIERRWGIFDPALDPTRETTYAFLDALLGEVATLFPDPYVHVGGDEVNGKEWAANPRIQAWMERRGLAGAPALQAHFNRRLQGILKKHGKRMAGWDEVLAPTLPKDVLVQSWRGPKGLVDAAAAGHPAILSSGWYLDHMRPASFHYAVDPLGGEACSWSEYVTEELLDARLWPRLAAVAERLWSKEATSVDEMYRRLGIVSLRLEALGLSHRTTRARMLARLTGREETGVLEAFAGLLEPPREYGRSALRAYTSATPLNRLVDLVRAESEAARLFSRDVDRFLGDPARLASRGEVGASLAGFRAIGEDAAPRIAAGPLLAEAAPLAADLAPLATLGLRALDRLAENGEPLVLTGEEEALLLRAGKPCAEVSLAVAPAILRLVEAAKAPPAPRP